MSTREGSSPTAEAFLDPWAHHLCAEHPNARIAKPYLIAAFLQQLHKPLIIATASMPNKEAEECLSVKPLNIYACMHQLAVSGCHSEAGHVEAYRLGACERLANAYGSNSIEAKSMDDPK